MNENLVRCIDHINQLEPRPDLVLVTGDITGSGQRLEAEQAAQLLADLQVPFYIVPGNHDDRMHLRSAFDQRACPSASDKFIYYVIEHQDIRLIAMDTTKPGEAGGEICANRAAWLDESLSQAPHKPTIIFMHHPPLKFGTLETDKDGFDGDDLLADVITKYTNIERIICGHIHSQAFAKWAGTIVSTAPSMGMLRVLDFTLRKPSQFFIDDPVFQLHYWSLDKNLISHNVRIGDMEGALLVRRTSLISHDILNRWGLTSIILIGFFRFIFSSKVQLELTFVIAADQFF